MKKQLFYTLALLALIACGKSKNKPVNTTLAVLPLVNGIYGASFQGAGSITIPFVFEVTGTDTSKTLCVWNAKERIPMLGKQVGDSLVFPSPVFNTYLIGKVGPSGFNGSLVYQDKDLRIPFQSQLQPEASLANYKRFSESPDSTTTVDGKWATTFNNADQTSNKAVGEFFAHGNRVFGSFLSERGDYRYLEGIVSKGKLMLSGFDGAVVFLFTGDVVGNKITNGVFVSGTNQVATWTATQGVPANFLENPDKISQLKNTNTLSFRFPGLHGDTLSLSDPKYKGKVVIVQIMGTWCHNCMDETQYLSQLYSQYQGKNVEIIGLAFETRAKTLEEAQQNILKTKNHFNVHYDLAIATYGKENKADEFLKQLDGGIKAFPSTIYIGKDGKVDKIHVGFTGPGTSQYTTYVQENAKYIDHLLNK